MLESSTVCYGAESRAKASRILGGPASCATRTTMTTLRMWQKELVLSSKGAAGGTPVTQEKLTVDRISAIHEEWLARVETTTSD